MFLLLFGFLGLLSSRGNLAFSLALHLFVLFLYLPACLFPIVVEKLENLLSDSLEPLGFQLFKLAFRLTDISSLDLLVDFHGNRSWLHLSTTHLTMTTTHRIHKGTHLTRPLHYQLLFLLLLLLLLFLLLLYFLHNLLLN